MNARRNNRGMHPLLAFAALSLALAAPPLWGAIQALTLEQIAERAPWIVTGEVQSISDGYRVHWKGIGRVVCSDVTIRVAERWKGDDIGAEVTLQIPGGRLAGGARVVCAEAPEFEVGEHVLLFVGEYRGRRTAYGWESGKYTIRKGAVQGREGAPIDSAVETSALRRRIEAILSKGR